MDKSELEQHICGKASISCIVRKTGLILPLLVGLQQSNRQKHVNFEF